jgi:hypothetical protein
VMNRIAGSRKNTAFHIPPEKVIAILNDSAEPDEDKIPDEREIDIISSTPTRYHFIAKHATDTQLVYTNVYFMGKKIHKPRISDAGMVFLESTMLKLLDLYRKSSEVLKTEIEETLEPVSSNKKLAVDITLKNRLGKFQIHAFFDFADERLDIKKIRIDDVDNDEIDSPEKTPEMLIKINSEENYVVDSDEKALCFRKKIFITAKN